MSGPVPVPQLPREFDAFLFAPIGTERNGMLLSVASALARRDIDPWQEAAALAGMPETTAIGRLAPLIGVAPGGTLTGLDAGATAARLIALLPHRRAPVGGASRSGPGPEAFAHEWRLLIIVYAVITLAMLGANLTAGSHPVVARPGSVHGPVARVAAPSAPPSLPRMNPGGR